MVWPDRMRLLAEPIQGEGKMKEHPLICRASVVQAILEGRQTQDRRPVKPQPPERDFDLIPSPKGTEWAWMRPGKKHLEVEVTGWIKAPWQVGDHLWVRETFLVVGGMDSENPRVVYRATNSGPDAWGSASWKPSIHMPWWASRITLEVLNVRVERVQEITEEDAKAEGVEPFNKSHWEPGDCWTDGKYKTAFQYLWNELYGWAPNAWERNPFVWVTDFRRLK
jgi:hypothetical protein